MRVQIPSFTPSMRTKYKSLSGYINIADDVSFTIALKVRKTPGSQFTNDNYVLNSEYHGTLYDKPRWSLPAWWTT